MENRPGDTIEASFRDSAGIVLVESTGPAWGSTERWQIELGSIRIGAIDGAAPYQFTRITGAARLPDGRILVLEQLTRQVRLFDENGRYLLSFGGPGQGPGEFVAFPSLAAVQSDSVIVFDPATVRLTWFGIDGAILRTETLDREAVARVMGLVIPQDVITFPDGSVLLIGQHAPSYAELTALSTGRVAYRVQFDVMATLDRQMGVIFPDGTAGLDLGRHPYLALGRILGGGDVANPFHHAAYYATESEPARIHITVPGRREVLTYDSRGQVRRIVRQAGPLAPLTAERIAEYRRAVLDAAEARNQPASSVTSLLDQATFPDSIRPYQALYADTQGNLWVEDYQRDPNSAARKFQIFDPSGAWLGGVSAPSTLGEIFEIGDDYILSAQTDEFDVPYLLVSRIRKE